MNEIYDGTISGIATALVWAVLALGYNAVRNFLLERRLREAFKWQGRGFSREGFTVSVNNRTNVPVTVRRVNLFEAYPTSSARLLFYRVSDDVIQTPLRNIGDTQTEQHLYRAIQHQPTERDFIDLPAHTGADWILPDKMVVELDWCFAACQVVLEYADVFGNRTVIAVLADEAGVGYMTKAYRDYREQLLARLSSAHPKNAQLPPAPTVPRSRER